MQKYRGTLKNEGAKYGPWNIEHRELSLEVSADEEAKQLRVASASLRHDNVKNLSIFGKTW